MSKKNNKSIKARAHAHALEREKLQRERLEKLAEKNARRVQRKEERAAAAGGVAKKKHKNFRIRKGVHIKGIKVVDSETKHKALRALKRAQAAKMMEVDGAAAGSGKAARKKKGKVKVVALKGKGKPKAKAAAAAVEAPAAMET